MRYFRVLVKSCVIFSVMVFLSACSSGGSYLSALTGNSNESVSLENSEAAANSEQNLRIGSFCPLAGTLAGAETLRLYAGEQTQKNVRVQFHISDIKRRCEIIGTQTQITVAVSGTVIKGPKSQTNQYQGSIRLVIVDQDFKPVTGGKRTPPFTIPQGATNTSFSIELEPLTVETTDPVILKDYQILAGFDGES